jgi:hypothetical protein
MPLGTWKKFSPPGPAPHALVRWALPPVEAVGAGPLLRTTTTEVAVVALLAARCRTMPRS